jgi:FtsP/CotA-like multicopper oxidase with cupredoxin domain
MEARRLSMVCSFLVIAALCLGVGQATAQENAYQSKRQAARDYLEQAIQERSDSDPLFRKYVDSYKATMKEITEGDLIFRKHEESLKATKEGISGGAGISVTDRTLQNYLDSLTVPPGPAGLGNIVPPGAIGFNPAVNYNLPNFSQSPNIRKFVDKLPGVGAAGCTESVPAGTGTCNENNLGQYIPLAVPDMTTYPGSDYYEITTNNYSSKMHSDLPPTALRGYAQTNTTDPAIKGVNQYLGPLIIGRVHDPANPAGINGNGKPVRLKFTNGLPFSTTPAGKLGLPVDTTVMGAGMGPVAGQNYTENRVSIPHLHGGRTPWISDGTPHQWITPAGDPTPYKKGASFQNVPDMIGPGKSIPAPAAGDGMGTLFWTNQQSPRMMFYHDHAYGITRLNVYKGVAAGYLLVDQVEDDLIAGTNVSGANPGAAKILPDLGGVYHYGIPLVFQDKCFVNDASTPPGAGFPPARAAGLPPYVPAPPTLSVDPLWQTYVGTLGGNLWFPHEYMPIENIYDPTGNTTNGRWDYAPFMIPPMVPLNLTLPSPAIVPEAFCDTAVVNGTAFPYVELPPDAVRLRILNASNDRMLNLQIYYAKDKNGVICKAPNVFDAASCTEVSMVPAVPNPAFPTWPRDGREGGVPDPLTKGPDWIQIGNESGFLAKGALWPAQPVDYEYNRQSIPFAGVTSRSLLLLTAGRADVIADFSGAKAGDVLIVYNDAPAPMPMSWPVNDYYTDDPDQTAVGGPVTTAPGFGPNTRTFMQIRVKGTKTSPFDFSVPNGPSLVALEAALPKAFALAQPQPLVPATAYNAAYPGFATTDIYAQGPDSTLNVTGVGQGIARIRVTLPGNNYLRPPTVVISGGGGTGAKATASLNGVTGIVVTATGTGYTTPPTVTVARPNVAGGIQCTAVATLSGGVVTAIDLIEPGSGYTVAPAVTITGGGGKGATATATVTLNSVGSVTVTNPGSGYISEPHVYLTGGGGMGASAVALLSGALVMTGKSITEGFDAEYGRMDVKLGSTPNPLTPNVGAGFSVGISRYIDPPTEYLNNNETVLWRISHVGVDSHALHFHLFDVQVVNRVYWTNVIKPPYPDELGWRETIRTNPMEDIIVALRPRAMVLPFQIPNSTRLLDVTTPVGSTANFSPVVPPPGVPAVAQMSNVMTNFNWEYVWHCHLLGHEENDMMRPIAFVVSPPAAPSGLAALVSAPTPSTAAVALTWVNPDPGADGYTIQRATNSTFTAGLTTFTVTGSPPAKAYNDATVAPASGYYYRVQAFNSVATSAWSNVVTVVTIMPPSGLAAGGITRNSVVLNWVNNTTAGTTGVSIQYAKDAAFTTGLKTVSIATPNLATTTVTGLSRKTTYYFRVAATAAGGNSGWSNAVTATTLP